MPIKHLKLRKLSGVVVDGGGVVFEGTQQNYGLRLCKEHLGHVDSLHVFQVLWQVTFETAEEYLFPHPVKY